MELLRALETTDKIDSPPRKERPGPASDLEAGGLASRPARKYDAGSRQPSRFGPLPDTMPPEDAMRDFLASCADHERHERRFIERGGGVFPAMVSRREWMQAWRRLRERWS